MIYKKLIDISGFLMWWNKRVFTIFLNGSSLSGYISWSSEKKNWFTYITFNGINGESLALLLLVIKKDDDVFWQN